MRLHLTDDDGTLVKTWDSSDDPETFASIAASLLDLFAITRSTYEQMIACDSDDPSGCPECGNRDGDCLCAKGM